MKPDRPPYSVFITGIAGFIGYHLSVSLKQKGNRIMGCDNFNSYYSPEIKKARAQKLQEQGVDVVNCDIRDQKQLEVIFNKQQFTHVIHLAAQAGVYHSIMRPHLHGQTNLLGFLHILELCRRHQPLKLIFASSSSVYGETTRPFLSESDPTDHPISLYAATKKSGELMAQTYYHLYRFPLIGLRYFTVYGPWGRPDMAYHCFADAIWTGNPIDVFNHGEMRRDFTYIDDIVDGTEAALKFEGKFEVFNLGSGRSEKLMDMVHFLGKFLGKTPEIIFKPMRKGDVKHTCAQIKKARDMLGFRPRFHLEEGLEKFAAWYLDQAGESLSIKPKDTYV